METQDWLRAMALLGRYGEEYIPVLLAADGSLFAVFRGSYDGELTTVAVDADGNLLALLRGEYAGEPKTVAVDSAGRLSAFVIDSSDAWGNILACGNAELAARLGSICHYDRRGQVILAENWAHGMGRWGSMVGISHGYSELDTNYWCSAGYSVRMESDSLEGGPCTLAHWESPQPNLSVGFGLQFSLGSVFQKLSLTLHSYTGTMRVTAELVYDYENNRLQYMSANGSYVTLSSVSVVNTESYVFHTIKLVADLGSAAYIRAMFEGVEYGMTGVSCMSRASAYAPSVACIVTLDGEEGETRTCYVDDLIVTCPDE